MLTSEQMKVAKFLENENIRLGHGLGTKTNPCSIASINLALSGRLSDNIPDCVSYPLGKWIILIQDSMSEDMINSKEWRDTLPLIIGTDDREAEHTKAMFNWLFETVLPHCQSVADKKGFGDAWRKMYGEPSLEITKIVERIALDQGDLDTRRVADHTSRAQLGSFHGSPFNPDVGRNVAWATFYASHMHEDRDEFWRAVNPAALLAKMVDRQPS